VGGREETDATKVTGRET